MAHVHEAFMNARSTPDEVGIPFQDIWYQSISSLRIAHLLSMYSSQHYHMSSDRVQTPEATVCRLDFNSAGILYSFCMSVDIIFDSFLKQLSKNTVTVGRSTLHEWGIDPFSLNFTIKCDKES